MPRDQNQSVAAYITDKIDFFYLEETKIKKNPKGFRKKMKKYGLDDFRAECLVLRFVYDMSYQQIADAMSSPTKWVVFGAVKSGLEMLKERGYADKYSKK